MSIFVARLCSVGVRCSWAGMGQNINRCTLHFVIISFYIELKVVNLLYWGTFTVWKIFLLIYTNLYTLHSQHWQLRTDHISNGMPFFEIFPEFKKDVQRYHYFVTHIEETCRKREKEGRNIIIKNMCSLESKAKNKKGILIYMKKKVRIKLIVS